LKKINSTLKVFHEKEVKAVQGHVENQKHIWLAGTNEHPSERMTVFTASFKQGVYEPLHWHLIEGLYYIISGSAVMKDIEGNTYKLHAGSTVYTPAGIAGAHSWNIKKPLKLIAVRAAKGPLAFIQFVVDEETKTSSITLDHLKRANAIELNSLY
jgi:quercetin dioxygenase-like cupin family protein